MSRLKRWIRGFSPRQIALSLTAVLCLCLFLAVTLWCNHKIEDLADQQAALRWDREGGAAQVSCFFTRDVEVDDFQIMSFEKQLESALTEAAVVLENPNARLFVDAYSAQGKITVTSSQSTLDAAAVGIGGDFFFFHPV